MAASENITITSHKIALLLDDIFGGWSIRLTFPWQTIKQLEVIWELVLSEVPMSWMTLGDKQKIRKWRSIELPRLVQNIQEFDLVNFGKDSL